MCMTGLLDIRLGVAQVMLRKKLTPLAPPFQNLPQTSVCAYTSCEKHN